MTSEKRIAEIAERASKREWPDEVFPDLLITVDIPWLLKHIEILKAVVDEADTIHTYDCGGCEMCETLEALAEWEKDDA